MILAIFGQLIFIGNDNQFPIIKRTKGCSVLKVTTLLEDSTDVNKQVISESIWDKSRCLEEYASLLEYYTHHKVSLEIKIDKKKSCSKNITVARAGSFESEYLFQLLATRTWQRTLSTCFLWIFIKSHTVVKEKKSEMWKSYDEESRTETTTGRKNKCYDITVVNSSLTPSAHVRK